MKLKHTLLTALLLPALACTELDDAKLIDMSEDQGITDMPNTPDAEPDQPVEPDAGEDIPPDQQEPCGGSCAGTTPICDTSTDTCVGCLDSDDCSGANPVCDTDAKTCVACLDNAQCTTEAASKCEANACAACGVNADCAHLAGKTTCDSGVCKQCSKDDDSACNGNSCDLATNTCTTTPKASVAVCGACKADSECSGNGRRCVPMNFMGNLHGNYCLIDDAIGDCAQPYGTSLERTSLGGVESFYCGVNESLTTCEAVRDLQSNKACADANDHQSCGAPGSDDARCVNMSPVGNPNFRCSYRCGTDNQCLSGTTCREEVGSTGIDVCR